MTTKPSTPAKPAAAKPSPSTTAPASTTTPPSTPMNPEQAARLSELQNLVQLATLHGVDVSDDVLKERDALAAEFARRAG